MRIDSEECHEDHAFVDGMPQFGDCGGHTRCKELFYIDAQRFMQSISVRATADGGLAFGAPQPVHIPRFAERHWGTVYDVSPDGSRVYFPQPWTARAPHEFGVVLGGRALLQR